MWSGKRLFASEALRGSLIRACYMALLAGACTRAMLRVEQMRNEAGSLTGSPRARDKGKERSCD
jgi:hypothetical protein